MGDAEFFTEALYSCTFIGAYKLDNWVAAVGARQIILVFAPMGAGTGTPVAGEHAGYTLFDARRSVRAASPASFDEARSGRRRC